LTETDINNDGIADVVLKSPFILEPKGLEFFEIYPKGNFDVSKSTYSDQDISNGTNGKRIPRRIIFSHSVNRLFRFAGTTYIHRYVFCAGPGNIETCGMFDAPEVVIIEKYVNGGESLDRPAVWDEVCKFSMNIISEK
jgi:hypothetical protein